MTREDLEEARQTVTEAIKLLTSSSGGMHSGGYKLRRARGECCGDAMDLDSNLHIAVKHLEKASSFLALMRAKARTSEEMTASKAASAASKVFSDPKASKAAKTAAASILTQRERKP